ncbi:20S-pre-rRNA D-site endonuclease nob1 [Tieghemiomyces parasiticus]|uniref:20S-pre-rRNA D-site endonuclease nob1 n=1 Tax=Tieghemiomyces parasiticus TaxID=78921 RepID=A0A9W8E2G5_9FUNG|nr:20S-pre-rRNA D-site endonuclease nob1 [Tieghemiomyces parasiticus]
MSDAASQVTSTAPAPSTAAATAPAAAKPSTPAPRSYLQAVRTIAKPSATLPKTSTGGPHHHEHDSESGSEYTTDSGSDYDDDTEDEAEQARRVRFRQMIANPMASASALEKPFDHLVLDAGPIFNNMTELGRLANHFYTVPDVIQEIRNADQRRELKNNVHFQLKIREPEPEDMVAVMEFAKKTGDYAALSIPDLKVMALTYTLEREQNGVAHLRSDPRASARVTQAPGAAHLVAEMNNLSLDQNQAKHEEAEAFELRPKPKRADDDDGWITPANLAFKQAQDSGALPDLNSTPKGPLSVACATTDFAVQNVALQIGLNLASVSGYAIKHLKTRVLRCFSCFTVTRQMEKKFCPTCGHPTLNRVPGRVDQKGNLHLFLSKKFRVNKQGTKYTIPRPVRGRHPTLVLREDQKEFERAVQHNKTKKANGSAFDLDYVPDFLSSNRGKPGTRVMSDIVGHGRRNPNVAKRTGNRKKKSH